MLYSAEAPELDDKSVNIYNLAPAIEGVYRKPAILINKNIINKTHKTTILYLLFFKSIFI